MINLKNKSGITLIAMIITIIVIIILVGISVGEGTKLIKRAKIESLMTNMIMIKANAKIYAEEVNAQIWDLSDQDKVSKRKELFQDIYDMVEGNNSVIAKVDSSINDQNGCEVYNITTDTLNKMGLSDLANESEDGEFVVVYNSADYTKLEIVYPSGVPYENINYYSLTDLQNKMNE